MSIGNPRISVVVPIFNSEATLERCLSSILYQTYTNFELIAVNDGSIDGSQTICESFANRDARVRLVVQANNGASSARNHGIEIASGEWIAFADSDDWVAPNWLEKFIQNITPNVDLVAQGYYWRKINTQEELLSFGESSVCTVPSAVKMFYEQRCLGYIWNKLFNLELLNTCKVRFSQNYKILEDEEFVLRYLAHCEAVAIAGGNGDYHYCMPDFSVKYRGMMNFNCYFDLIGSLKKIYGDKYLHSLLYPNYIESICLGIIECSDERGEEYFGYVQKVNDWLIVRDAMIWFKTIKLFPLNLLRAHSSPVFWRLVFRCTSWYLSIIRMAVALAGLLKWKIGERSVKS